jgi:hypothetical protein
MMQKLKSACLVLLFAAGAFGFTALALPATEVAASDQQNILGQLCDGPNRPDGANCDKTASEGGVTDIMGQVINVASWIAGIVSTIVLIIGGIMYVVSGGSPDQTAKARSAIIYALVGLGVALAANLLVDFVFEEIQTLSP